MKLVGQMQMQKPCDEEGSDTVWEAGERKEHQPRLTLTKESKAGAASTPVSPWVPSQMGLVVIYTRETDSGEEKHKQEEGELSKPFAFFYHSSQPNILYYYNAYNIHILSKKHAGFYFFFFLKKVKLKYFSKNTVSDMANKTFRNHIILQRMQLVCVCKYDTERLHGDAKVT